MATQKKLFDLVFFGTERQGAERVEALRKLAAWMKVGPDDLARILDENRGVIAPDLDAAAGSEAHRQMVALGIRANLRPSASSGLSLALVPKEKPATVVTCPACGHIHRAKADDPAPLGCEKCGIVFAKYEKVAQEKLERERIRQTLLSEQQRRQELEQKELEERQAQERRRQLEAEVRRQLGLPRMVSSRSGLIGSAAGIYLLGITMGSGGVYAVNFLSGSGTLAPDHHMRLDSGVAVGQLPGEMGGLDPGMAAAMRVSALVAAVPGGGGPALGGGGPAFGGGGPAFGGGGPATGSGLEAQLGTAATVSSDPAGVAAGAAPVRPQPPQGFLASRLADLKTDPEWDLFVLARIHDLVEAGATARAVTLVDHLHNPDLRFERGAWLAVGLWQDGRAVDADGLYQRLSAAAARQPDTAGARVAAFCTLARVLNRGGRSSDAQRLLQQASNSAATVTAPADRAAADAEIGALLTDLGRPQEARAYFQAVTQGLSRIPTPADRVSAIPSLARGFVKAGYRASALSFLEDATKNIASITDPGERARVLGQIATTDALIGDMQAAKGAAAQIPSRSDRDRALYRILGTEIAAERLANAIDLAQGLQTPAYRALASGLLALRQQRQAQYRAMAAASAEQAAAAVAAITDPAERAAVVAELGRFAARSGDTVAAERYFADAHGLAGTIPLGSERDQLLAILATNEALALRLAEARNSLPQITDAPLRLALVGELRGLEEVADAVGS